MGQLEKEDVSNWVSNTAVSGFIVVIAGVTASFKRVNKRSHTHPNHLQNLVVIQ